MSEAEPTKIDAYVEKLQPLFIPHDGASLDFISAVLRISGMQDEGWDALDELQSILKDLHNLLSVELPADKFPNRIRTRWRLALLFYAHMVEMDGPYEILGTLLRVRAGQPYMSNPFEHLRRPRGKKVPGQLPAFTEFIEPSPRQKIEELEKLAKGAGCSDAVACFADFYYANIRNTIDHSDYALTESEFRMLSEPIFPSKRSFTFPSRVVPLQQLHKIIGQCGAFYSAFFRLSHWIRAEIGKLAHRVYPVDSELKGLLEILVDDEGLLTGICMHWPNGSVSTFRRQKAGACDVYNCLFNKFGGSASWSAKFSTIDRLSLHWCVRAPSPSIHRRSVFTGQSCGGLTINYRKAHRASLQGIDIQYSFGGLKFCCNSKEASLHCGST